MTNWKRPDNVLGLVQDDLTANRAELKNKPLTNGTWWPQKELQEKTGISKSSPNEKSQNLAQSTTTGDKTIQRR